MPIDPSVLTPNIIKPISVAGVVHDAAVVQEAQARAQAYRDKQMEVARDRQENDQIRSVMQQSGGQLDDATFAAIRQISPTKAMDIEKLHNDSTKSSMEIENAKIDHDLKVLSYTSRQLGGVTDQHSYDMARAGIKATTGRDLPEQYDPAQVQAWQEQGMTYAEKLADMREERQAKYQQMTATRADAAAELANKREDRMASESSARLGLERQRVGLEGARVGMERQRLGSEQSAMQASVAAADPNAPHGEAFLSKLPTAQQAQVKALTEGRMQFPTGMALKSPYWQQMLSNVAQYDPNFDTVNYNARAKTRSDFTSGKSAQQVNALNTVIGHLDTLANKAKDLNNSSWKSYNSLANFVSSETGDPRVNNFNVAREAVVDELTRVWRQAGGSEQDIVSRKKQLDTAGSPEQLYGAIAEMGHLLESKLSSMQEQYAQGTGTKPIEMVTPQARQTLSKLERLSGQGDAGGSQQKPIPGIPGGVAELRNGRWIRVK